MVMLEKEEVSLGRTAAVNRAVVLLMGKSV
jgi:hypothetical protein